MWPTVLESGALTVPTYSVTMVLAFSAAILYVHLNLPRVGIVPDKMFGAYIGAMVGGILGARLWYKVYVETDAFLANPLTLFDLTGGGLAIYGGLFGGVAAVWGWVVYQKLPAWKVADVAVPGVALAMGIGRIGCLAAGCCHGAVAPHVDHALPLLGDFSGGQIWLSSVFPYVTTEFSTAAGGVSRLVDVPLYPTQMWSALASFTVAGVTAWWWLARRSFDGQVTALALMLEPPTRFLAEAFRADHRGYAFTFPVNDAIAQWFPGMTEAGAQMDGAMMGLTSSQLGGLFMFAGGVVIYALQFRHGVAPETPIEDDEDLLEVA